MFDIQVYLYQLIIWAYFYTFFRKSFTNWCMVYKSVYINFLFELFFYTFFVKALLNDVWY